MDSRFPSDMPTVACVMLTANRPEMAARAIRCFRRQTYEHKSLMILNSGDPLPFPDFPIHMRTSRGKSIGLLRNMANDQTKASILVHWDDDDYSHPYRIAEQVDLLLTSRKQVVGYRDMLFWRETANLRALRLRTPGGGWTKESLELEALGLSWPPEHGWLAALCKEDESWLYTHPHPSYCLGTSLCYWRKTWERKPFPDQPKPGVMTGEDTQWLMGLDSIGVASVDLDTLHGYCFEPRMIATIHGSNTSGQYANIETSSSWKRVPEWDAAVRKTMEEA